MSPTMEETFSPGLKSWVPNGSPGESGFPIQNLPLGVFCSKNNLSTRVGIAIGDLILDLAALDALELLRIEGLGKAELATTSLNALIAKGPKTRQSLRIRVSQLLSKGCSELSEAHKAQCLVPQNEAQMLLPVHVGDFVDFYSSLEHATNVGSMFRDPENPLLPNWKHIPIGYHGRSSSLYVSGQPIFRPFGQLKPENEPPIYAPSRMLDFELEMGFIVGRNTSPGETISARSAADAMFGMVLVNDWSARDIQKWEYVPLGPFLGKSFATTVSPWVVTMDVIERLRCPGPSRDVPILPYLEDGDDKSLNIKLQVALRSEKMEQDQVICSTNFRHMYWTINQQLAHMTINGTPIRIGDLYASGTVSGTRPDSFGSMLELCWKGTRPLQLSDGSERKFIADHDTVVMTGEGELPGGIPVSFGRCEAQLLPAGETR